jgi:hypothetical protein
VSVSDPVADFVYLGEFDGRACALMVSEGLMGKPSPVDDERWRDEAAGAVFGDDDWKWVSACISPGGSQLVAVSDCRPTATRAAVTLPRDKFLSGRARVKEIHRQLGLWPTPTEPR